LKKVLGVSIGEIALKGLNRRYFEDQLINQIVRAIKDIGYENIYKEQGKIYIVGNDNDYSKMVNRLKKVFGLVRISPCIRINKNFKGIQKASIISMEEAIDRDSEIKTFKVDTNRADKSFTMKSPQISRQIGGILLNEFDSLNVDVHEPDIYLYIDIRRDYAYIYNKKIKAYGGLPVGTNGKGLLLLSGGIDSPAAGFMMAKRGIDINCVHYHSYPFTSERAEEKVKILAKILSRYTGRIKFHSINLLEIQKEINAKCPEREMTILSRRFMMRIAESIARYNGYNALITGENLGQVASQTVESIGVINDVVSLSILRPLIGMDKIDIIDIAKDIETYETSILPFEDACTVFLPKHPVTKPRLRDIQKSEEVLDTNKLVENAVNNMEVYTID